MTHDLVSIILPTYNGARYLRGSVESCLRQTHRELEVIIVDDCSTDATPEIAQGFADTRVRYLRHATNRKLPAALNTGFTQAQGAYLTWTSDDNWYADDAIAQMLAGLRETDSEFVYTDYFIVREDEPEALTLFRTPDPFDPTTGETIGACFLYIRDVMVRVGGYDEETFLAEDYDYWIRVSQQARMHHLALAPYYYRLHPHSLTASFERTKVVQASSALVRVKNGVIDPERAAAIVVEPLAHTAVAPPLWLRAWFKGLRLLTGGDPYARQNAAVLQHLQQRLEPIFSAYQARRLSFTEAKEQVVRVLGQAGRLYRWG